MKAKLILFLCACCLLASCQQADSGSQSKNLLFAWTEGYLACPTEEENLFALTFYARKNALPFAISDIASVELNNTPETFSLRYQMELTDIKPGDGYQAYSIYFSYMSQEAGTFDTDSVVFSLSNGKQVTYPFGHITFDFDEADSELMYTWESPGASSNSALFPYSYACRGADASLAAMQLARDWRVDTREVQGSVSLTDTYTAPVIYIRAKLFVEKNGETRLSYGKGCYCGGVSVNGEKSVLQQSMEHWSQNL